MKTKTILTLILPDIHLLDLAGADQVFLEAKDFGLPLRLLYCGTGGRVKSSSGLPFGPLKGFWQFDLAPGDFLFIPGAALGTILSGKIPREKSLWNWLNVQHGKGVTICSVCSGAFLLGRAGLLDGVQCTTHWKRTTELQQLFPEAKVKEEVLFTEDANLYTSAGVASGIDLALALVARMKDEEAAYKVARELVVYQRRQGNDAQQSAFIDHRQHMSGVIHGIQDYIREHIHQKITLDRLAEEACMSARNLTRVFRQVTGTTINHYITLVRKEILRKMESSHQYSRKEMAARCGLKSERQVIRLMQRIAV